MPSKPALLSAGMDAFSRRIERKKTLYEKIYTLAAADRSGQAIIKITDPTLFKETLSCFGTALEHDKAKFDLATVYEAALHRPSGALLIANKGATLYALSPKTGTPSITRHIGICAYVPGNGVEFVNVGLVGDVYGGTTVLRSESACTPSFLFGSQRCNCAHQWDMTRELAAHFNPASAPEHLRDGRSFEKWVQTQVVYQDGKHVFARSGKQGFILMHIDTQNGMGSGFTADEFSFDLFTRSSLRHRGEYSSEQIHGTTMSGGFEAIGLMPDPRQAGGGVGYSITPIILDYLGVSKKLLFLSNNRFKIAQLTENGYEIDRVPLIGEVNLAGAQEAEERGTEFDHLTITGTCITFEEEFERLAKEITARV